MPPGPDRVASFVVGHRGAVFAAVAVVTLLAAWSAADLSFDTSIRSWFLEDDPVLVSYAEFQEHFGSDELVLITVEVADDGPDGLGVFAPEVLAVIDRLRIGVEQSVNVARVRSLLDSSSVRYEDGAVRVGPLADDVPTTVPEARLLRTRALDSPLINGSLVTPDGRMSMVVVDLEPERTDLMDKLDFVAGLREVVETEEGADGVTFRMTGLPVIDSTVGDLARNDALRVGPASSLVVILIGWLVFGRLRTAFVPLFVVSLAVLWTLGFIGLMGWRFGILGGPLMNVVLAVGVADAVHVLADTLHRMSADKSPLDALRESLAELLVPCFFTSITTTAGFLALLTSDVGPIREFGALAAVGAMSAFVLTFTFLPVFVAWVRPPGPSFLERERTGPLSRLLERLAAPPSRSGPAVLAVFAIVVVVSGWGMTRVHVGANPIRYFRDGTPARTDTLAIEPVAGGSATIELLAKTPYGGLRDPATLARLGELEAWLEAQPGVTSVDSVLDVLRETRRALMRGAATEAVLPESSAMAAQLYLLIEGEEDFDQLVQQDASIGRLTARIRMSQLEDVIDFAPSLQERLATEYSDDSLTVSATGYGLLFARLEGYLVNSQARGMLVAFLAITIMLALLLRSLRLALFAMIPNLAPVVVGLAIMAALDIPLDPGTLMVGPLCLGLVVDDTVHFLVRYRRHRGLGEDSTTAAAAAVRGTGRAIVLTTVLLAGSFLTLLAAGTAMAMHFGVIAAIVAVLALIADLVVLPAALRLL